MLFSSLKEGDAKSSFKVYFLKHYAKRDYVILQVLFIYLFIYLCSPGKDCWNPKEQRLQAMDF